jgi:guanylate kinase
MSSKQPLIGNCKRGKLFVLSAPAGTGKTTLVQRLVAEFPTVVQSISYTTRKPREQEVTGDHYFFISKEEFEKKIADHEFLEYVLLYGDYYGTSKVWVESMLAQGKHLFLVIDTQGALQLMDSVEACFIFMKPPSMDVLKERLVARNSETEESMKKRLDWAEKELETFHYYDYVFCNDDLDTAYQILRSIVIAEEHKNP